MAKDYDKEDGVWRTIGGRKVFIRKGQNLADAMIESGKFKGQKNKPGMRESYREQKEKDLKEEDDLYDIDKKKNTLKSLQDFGKKAKENEQLYSKSEKEEVDENEKSYPYREQYKQEGQTDLENIKEWKQYRDANQKALNRTTIPYNAQRNLNEINVANKEIDKARNNLSQKADEILGNKSTNEKAKQDAFDYSREEVTKAYETMRNKMQKHMDNNDDHWSGKEYTNAEFLAHLEDANWHGEMKQLREANLTPEQLTEIKDKTTLSSWGVGSELTGKENVKKMIDSVKNKSTNEKAKQDPYDDPESEESQRLQSIQSRYDDYLQQTEGRGASYGEIAYVESLRGKDLDDFEKELDEFEYKQSTNETMNQAIREKASKKKELEHWDNETLHNLVIANKQGRLDLVHDNDKYKDLVNKYGKDFIDKKYNDLQQNYEVSPDVYVHDDGYAEHVLRPKQNIESTNNNEQDSFRNDTPEKAKERLDNARKQQQEQQDAWDRQVEEVKNKNKDINDAIRQKASKKKEVEQDLPKHTEIKEQGTSNRKEVSENLQAHILDYYDSPEDFVEQMDAFDYLPTNWKRGEEIAKGGSYLIYNGDMADFLDSLKINPKGKKFDEQKAFDMYTSLIGRESAKLYERIKRNQFNQYKKDHPLTKMSFEDFKNMKEQ